MPLRPPTELRCPKTDALGDPLSRGPLRGDTSLLLLPLPPLLLLLLLRARTSPLRGPAAAGSAAFRPSATGVVAPPAAELSRLPAPALLLSRQPVGLAPVGLAPVGLAPVGLRFLCVQPSM